MTPFANWLYHAFGIGGSGPYYGFWSGAGSDIGELAILTGVLTMVRHHNCHVKGCWRLGRGVAGTPYIACHVHHPAHTADSRNVSAETIADAVQNANSAAPDTPVAV